MIIDYAALVFFVLLVLYFAYHLYDGCKTFRAHNKKEAEDFERITIEEFKEKLNELEEALNQFNEVLDKHNKEAAGD